MTPTPKKQSDKQIPEQSEAFEDWLHVKIVDPETSEQLDAMVAADDTDRSKFVRKLIRDEFLRRQQVHWVGNPSKPVKKLRVVARDVATETVPA